MRRVVMSHTNRFLRRTGCSLGSVLLIFALGGQFVFLAFDDKGRNDKHARTQTENINESIEATPTDSSILPVPVFDFFNELKTGDVPNIVPQVGVDLGTESEPNGTIATADTLTGAEGRIKGNIGVAGDIDYYSFS